MPYSHRQHGQVDERRDLRSEERKEVSRRITILGIGIAILTGSMVSQGQNARLTPELQRVRAALEKYRDPILAVHDGYFSTVGCLSFPDGDMGVHFLNPQLLGPVPDPMKPPILLYEPDGGRLHLVGAEWFIPLATGVKERPEVFGQPFDGPMKGHEPLLPADLHHYDLHVWLFKDNPAGLFKPTNPDVKCPEGPYTFNEQHPEMLPQPRATP